MQWLVLVMMTALWLLVLVAAPEVPDDVEDCRNLVRGSFSAQCCAHGGVPDPEILAKEIMNKVQKCLQSNTDVIFSGNYSLSHDILDCVEHQLDKRALCFTERDDYTSMMMDGLRAVVKLIGEGIAIEEKHRKCVSARDTQASIRECLQAANLTENIFELYGSQSTELTPNCQRLTVARNCIVTGLKLCEELQSVSSPSTTPSSVVDRLLRAYAEPLSCEQTTAGAAQPPLACLVLLMSLLLSFAAV